MQIVCPSVFILKELLGRRRLNKCLFWIDTKYFRFLFLFWFVRYSLSWWHGFGLFRFYWFNEKSKQYRRNYFAQNRTPATINKLLTPGFGSTIPNTHTSSHIHSFVYSINRWYKHEHWSLFNVCMATRSFFSAPIFYFYFVFIHRAFYWKFRVEVLVTCLREHIKPFRC